MLSLFSLLKTKILALLVALSVISPPQIISQSPLPVTQEVQSQSTSTVSSLPATSTSQVKVYSEPQRPRATSSPKVVEKNIKPSEISKEDILRNLGISEIPTQEPTANFDEINKKTRAALVNILCLSADQGLVGSVSGTGVFISSRGVILTNSHIAQNFLLKDTFSRNFMDCKIRMGAPARNIYNARLLYLSPSWLRANRTNIIEDSPKGTGDSDFALLLVTDKTDGTSAPIEFPHVNVDTAWKAIEGKSVLEGAYAAGFLSGDLILKDLHITSAVAKIGEIMSFDGVRPEFLALEGTVVAQQGSSGGAVVNEKGDLIGLIVSVTSAPTTGERKLGAITLGHIDRKFKEEAGYSISELSSSDLNEKANLFASKEALELEQILKTVIETKTRQ